MFLELLRNVAILLALCMAYTVLLQSQKDRTASSSSYIIGVLFGIAAVLAMLTPTALFPGVLIDSRSIFISMAGLVGGWPSALTATLMALICRFILGGTGAPVGYAIIVSSALFGVGYHFLRRKTSASVTKKQLYFFGLVVHVNMMLLMLALPADIRWVVFETVSVPVLLIYPIGTVLIGWLLAIQHERSAAERALTDSERRLSAILRAAPVGIGVVKDRVLLDVNPYVCELTGYRRDELVGQSARILYFTEEDFLWVGKEKYKQIKDKGIGTVEVRWRTKEGRCADVMLSSTPINRADPSAGTTFTVLDITQRKQMDEELRASLQKLKLHVQQTPLAVISWSPDFTVTEWNPAAEKMFGYTQEEALGRPVNFIVPEEWQAQVDEVCQELLSNTGGLPVTNENITKDGRIIMGEWYNTPLVDKAGKVIGVTSLVMDITARKKAEKDRERLMMAIEQAAEIVVITDADAVIQYVNPAFEKITGYSRAEAIGKNPSILKSGHQTPQFYQKMWQTLVAGKTWAGQLVNKRKDGTIYTEEATISPVTDSTGKIINYVAAKRDATHELELENQLRQAQKMEAVGQMAGGIAHDFNNLLQIISGYVELSEMILDPGNDIYPAIGEIGKAAMRGKGLVNQMLAFSRRQVIRPQDLNLNEVIRPLLDMMRGVMGEHIELDFIAGRKLGTVHADCGMMEQVLMNLCVNARDAMPDCGKLTIETENILIDGDYARTHAWATAGRYVLLNVTDTGCGMEEPVRQHIFEPFFTTKEQGKGTGLGLSTVFGIIKQHNGHINVYSELGKGTVFKIYLPTVERRVSEVSREVTGSAIGGNETLLIAEDDEAILALAEHLLSRAGYTVLTARDGEEAIQVFKEHADQIDAVMFDVVMPRLGGKQALDRILELRPGLPHLFASGYSENAVHTNFIQKRGLHLLNKPYQSETLLQKIREVLDKK
jgi:PAS domain S-box-containing protein